MGGGARRSEGATGSSTYGRYTTHLYSLELTLAAISAGILERVAIYLVRERCGGSGRLGALTRLACTC